MTRPHRSDGLPVMASSVNVNLTIKKENTMTNNNNNGECSPKPKNILRNPEDVQFVTRILQCASATKCARTIVEYDGDIPETRHSEGLPGHILRQAEILPNIELVMVPCDHHGGEQYISSVSGTDVL